MSRPALPVEQTYQATEVEVAWAAGLFEGEGNSYSERRGGFSAQLSSTDEEIVHKFARIMGFGNVGGPYVQKQSTKPYWTWRISRRTRVERLLEMFQPHLSERRICQLEAVLSQERWAE